LRRRAGQGRPGQDGMSMRFSDGSQLPEQRRGEANPVAGLGEEGSASPVWRFEGLCPGAASSSNHDTLLPPSSHPLPHSRALLRIELSRHWPGAALSAPTDQDAPSPIASQPASRAGFSIGKSHFDRVRCVFSCENTRPRSASRGGKKVECWKKVLSENFGSVVSRQGTAIGAQSSSLFTSTPLISLSVAGSHCLATCRTPTSPR
jgi:hypothetical protein